MFNIKWKAAVTKSNRPTVMQQYCIEIYLVSTMMKHSSPHRGRKHLSKENDFRRGRVMATVPNYTKKTEKQKLAVVYIIQF